MSDPKNGMRVGTWHDEKTNEEGVAIAVYENGALVGSALLDYENALQIADDIFARVPAAIVERFLATDPKPPIVKRPVPPRQQPVLRHRVHRGHR